MLFQQSMHYIQSCTAEKIKQCVLREHLPCIVPSVLDNKTQIS